MKGFAVELASQERTERLEGIVSFVGRDESGSFGILEHRAPLATALSWGLCRLRAVDGAEQYLALPGGMLFFDGNVLHIAARRYLRDVQPSDILRRLTDEEGRESQSRREVRDLLQRLDRELLARLFGRARS